MDAQDADRELFGMQADPVNRLNAALGESLQQFLLDAAPTLAQRVDLLWRAASLYAGLRGDVMARYVLLGYVPINGPESPPPGGFPWNKPAPYLWERLPQIEAMLAPLSDRRYRAHKLSTKARDAP